MKIAAVNWKLREIAREEEFGEHLGEVLDQCSDCDLAVLPELFTLEYMALADAAQWLRPAHFLAEFESLVLVMVAEHLYLQRHQTGRSPLVVLGTTPAQLQPKGRIRNRCFILDGDAVHHQDKNILTEWEKEIGVDSTRGLRYLSEKRVGVTICLDAEFPASGRALAEAGMLFQCVPAWTETMHGFRRVRWACQARAVENQVCVIHSSLVGKVGNEECHGSSAIICPPHEPFPLDPILAETPMDEEGVAIAEVDPSDLLKCRELGEVRNWRDRDLGDWTVTMV